MTSSYLVRAIIILIFLSFMNYHAQTKWHKYEGNPVLKVGASGEWDDGNIGIQCVLWDGSKYNIWYQGNDEAAGVSAIGYATSTDGINWVKYENNPVLEMGGPGEWDNGWIDPSSVLFNGTDYFMYYNGTEGNWDAGMIGLATSSDGINWIKDTVNNPVLGTGETGTWNSEYVLDPCVIYENSVYKMWYSGMGWYENLDEWSWKLGYAESTDGINWTKRIDPIMEDGDYETWANDLDYACVIYENNNYIMWYWSANTLNWNDRQQFNFATSTDGINWIKSENNPALERRSPTLWDNQSIWKPSVIKENNLYKMWYTGNGSEIGYAEDFSNLVHADTVMIENLYVKPNADPINVIGKVLSPEGHALAAKALFRTDDGTISDSIIIADDGLNGDGEANDGIYAGYWIPTNEDNYTVGIKTVDTETGFTNNGLNWNIIDKLTTKGPLVIKDVEFTSDTVVGARVSFNLFLENRGVNKTIQDVAIDFLIPEGACYKNTSTGTSTFGDLAPGESKKCSRYYAISFSDSCSTDEPYEIEIAIKSDNEIYWYDTLRIKLIPTDVENITKNLPKEYQLRQNYPNPFNPSTTIKYSIPKQSNVTLKVFDVLGSEVATLVNKEQPQGNYEVEFDGFTEVNKWNLLLQTSGW